MDYAALTPVENFIPPFFDAPELNDDWFKIYHDGSHYIASRCRKSEYRHSPHRSGRDAFDLLFDGLYKAGMAENKRGEALFAFIRSGFEGVVADFDVDVFIRNKIEREQRNLYLRKKRFRRKAYINKWNYFVTFTYSDNKCTEEEFRKKLRTCLSHLHTRRGWLYMGVFERAPDTGRLHFHGLFYVPDGEMLGKITKKKDYSTAKKKMQTRHENDFFESRFGRNDFEELNEMELKSGQTLNYILKYIAKTGERIVYSRGIPSEIYGRVSESDFVTSMMDYGTKYILFDDVIRIEVKRHNYKQLSIFDYRRVA